MTNDNEFYLTRFSILDDDILLTSEQAAVILNTTPQELANQRATGKGWGIDYVKMGDTKNAKIRYRVGDIKKHIKYSMRSNTYSTLSFADFNTVAKYSDLWPVVDLESSLKCFFESLEERDDYEPKLMTRLQIQKRTCQIEQMRLEILEADRERDLIKTQC